jgi:DNA-binding beta-propeller fold protein YncE
MHSVAAFLNVLPSLFSGGHRRHLASITLGQRCARRASSTNLCTKFRFAGVLTIGLVPFALMAQEQAPLKLVDTIALPELKDGDFDHFAVDLEGHRLFLNAEENGKVLVFDTSTNKLIHTIADLKAPHSAVYRSDSRKLFVVDGDDSAVKIYNGDSYQLTGQVKLAIDADSMAYDSDTGYLYVVNGGRAAHTQFSYISVIDTNAARNIKNIRIDSNQVEAISLEKSGPRLFCNITGKDAVEILDRTNGTLVTTWPLPPGDKRNVAVALDETNHRLFVVTADPALLIVLNSNDGKLVTSLPAVAKVDDMAYDPGQKRIYISGDQFIEVFQQRDANTYTLLAKIPGTFRAKTALLVPELNRYYLAVPKHGAKSAEVRVYEVQP